MTGLGRCYRWFPVSPRMSFFKCRRGSQYQRLVETSAHYLQPYGESFGVEAAGNRSRRLPGEVEGVGKADPGARAAFLAIYFRRSQRPHISSLEGGCRQSRSQHQVIFLKDLADLLVKIVTVELHSDYIAVSVG